MTFGVLLLIAGIVSLVQPEDTFAGVADILGFLFLVVAVFWLMQAFTERGANQFWWFGLIAGVAMLILAFWTSGQFFIEKQYVLLVFAGIWALFHGVGDVGFVAASWRSELRWACGAWPRLHPPAASQVRPVRPGPGDADTTMHPAVCDPTADRDTRSGHTARRT